MHEKQRKEILASDQTINVYTTIAAIAQAWGHEPHEWELLGDEPDRDEVVRLKRTEGQWSLEREEGGIWYDALVDHLTTSDILAVTPQWIEGL